MYLGRGRTPSEPLPAIKSQMENLGAPLHNAERAQTSFLRTHARTSFSRLLIEVEPSKRSRG